MLKKLMCLVLCCLLMLMSSSTSISAQTQSNMDSSAAKIKEKIIKRGTGEKKRITVKMSDGTELKGYVNQIGEDSFDFKNSNTGQIKTVAYGDVKQLKGKGPNIGLIVGLSVVAAVGIIAAVIIGKYCNNEDC